MLQAANELHRGQTMMDVICPGSFFFVSFLFFLTNYNTFFYILGYKPRDTTSAGRKLAYRGQTMTDVVRRPGVFFRVFLSFFQLNSCFFSIILGCKPSSTTIMRYHQYEPQTSHIEVK